MKQRYVSSELTHFTGKGLNTDAERYNRLRTIISTGTLKSCLGYYMEVYPDRSLSSEQRVVTGAVCFCDIPIQDFEIHMRKYSRFGLSFKKKHLISKYGASPVFYVANDAPSFSFLTFGTVTRKELFDAVAAWIDELLRKYRQSLNEISLRPSDIRRAVESSPEMSDMNKGETDNIIDAIMISMLSQAFDQHLLSYLKFFDTNLPEGHVDNTYMEREWRVLQSITFKLSEVERIIVPRKFARVLRADFPDFHGQVTFV